MLKTADALCEAGHVVHAYCSYTADWALPMDKSLMETRTWSLQYVGGLPGQLSWLWSRLRHRLARGRFDSSAGTDRQIRALSRTAPDLVAVARNDKADIYIGHNLGALPAVIAGARRNRGRSVFDLEDAYSDMSSNSGVGSVGEIESETLTRHIEDIYIPQCDELMAASDGIGEIYHQRYDVNPLTVLNAFPLEWMVESTPPVTEGSLRLFWFSQTIGPDRGLEDVLSAMARFDVGEIELHLLGRWQPGFQEDFFAHGRSLGLDPEACIYSYPPCQPEEIPGFAASFDVGLAVELPVSRNRDVCLTNKVFMYLLAGVSIVATETQGQKRFFEDLPQVGFTFPCGDVDGLVAALAVLHKDRQLLRRLSRQAQRQGRERYNWSIESRNLLKMLDRRPHLRTAS